jgi:hypothetical protein
VGRQRPGTRWRNSTTSNLVLVACPFLNGTPPRSSTRSEGRGSPSQARSCESKPSICCDRVTMILEDLVERVADVDVAVGVGRAVVEHEAWSRPRRTSRAGGDRGPSPSRRCSICGSRCREGRPASGTAVSRQQQCLGVIEALGPLAGISWRSWTWHRSWGVNREWVGGRPQVIGVGHDEQGTPDLRTRARGPFGLQARAGPVIREAERAAMRMAVS